MVKQIKGPSDHVVVVGAGYAGLSAALRLAGAGRKVTIIERESVPGGRSGLLRIVEIVFVSVPFPRADEALKNKDGVV